jgi:hypothetical protein
LFGLALIPKYASSMPLVHGVAENKVAVAEAVPVSAKLAGLASLLGTSTSMVKLPVAGPGEVVKPKFTGGLLVVGEFVPLSMHCPTPAQYPCKVSAKPSVGIDAKSATAPTNADNAALMWISPILRLTLTLAQRLLPSTVNQHFLDAKHFRPK